MWGGIISGVKMNHLLIVNFFYTNLNHPTAVITKQVPSNCLDLKSKENIEYIYSTKCNDFCNINLKNNGNI